MERPYIPCAGTLLVITSPETAAVVPIELPWDPREI